MNTFLKEMVRPTNLVNRLKAIDTKTPQSIYKARATVAAAKTTGGLLDKIDTAAEHVANPYSFTSKRQLSAFITKVKKYGDELHSMEQQFSAGRGYHDWNAAVAKNRETLETAEKYRQFIT
jgi:site-specific recombinase XerC